VQTDLTLKNTRHARGVDTIVNHVKNLTGIVDTCFDCHHSEAVNAKLSDLKSHVETYKEAFSRVLTIRANISRLEAEEDNAFRTGDELITKLNNMITFTSSRLEEKTRSSLMEINNTKIILFILIAAGPFLTAALAFVFIKGLTNPVKSLLNATHKLKGGDLDYRIGGLKYEFGEVAESFNEMATSLKEHMRKIEESEKRYRMLFESAGDAIFILDTDGENAGRIVAANRAVAEMHGYTVDELLTMNIKDLDVPEDAERVPQRMHHILEGKQLKGELHHRRKDGTVFPVEVTAGLFEIFDRKYILAFDRDIAERRRRRRNCSAPNNLGCPESWQQGLPMK